MSLCKHLAIFILLINYNISSYGATIIRQRHAAHHQKLPTYHSNFLINDIRVNWDKNESDSLSYLVAYNFFFIWYEEISELNQAISLGRFQVTDPIIQKPMCGLSECYLYHNLDRLLIEYNNSSDLTIRLGRQPVHFGKGRFVNPTDLFLPFVFNAVDQEYRPGIDSLRLFYPLDDVVHLEATQIYQKNNGSGEIAGNIIKLSLFEDHLYSEFIAIKKDKISLLGGSLVTELLSSSIWFEFSYSDISQSHSYFQIITGVEHLFYEKWFGSFEFYHNENGTTQVQEYENLQETYSYKEKIQYLKGKNYISATLSHTTNPLINSTVNLVSNLSDHSQLLTGAIEYNLFQDMYINITAMSSRLFHSPQGSEFFLFPDQMIMSIKRYW